MSCLRCSAPGVSCLLAGHSHFLDLAQIRPGQVEVVAGVHFAPPVGRTKCTEGRVLNSVDREFKLRLPTWRALRISPCLGVAGRAAQSVHRALDGAVHLPRVGRVQLRLQRVHSAGSLRTTTRPTAKSRTKSGCKVAMHLASGLFRTSTQPMLNFLHLLHASV